jgi:hypothetical protein
MSCNLCHEKTGHKPTCPTMIPVQWDTSRDSSAWEVLCREVFEGWVSDSLYENDGDWQRTSRLIRQHIEDGNAYDAYKLVKAYRDRTHKNSSS